MNAKLVVLRSDFRAGRVYDGKAHVSSGFDGREHLLTEDFSGALDPAVDEVIVPEIDQDNGCLLYRQVHVDLAPFEVFFAAWHTDGCAVLVVSDG